MLIDIIRFTPVWVWGLLSALIALGLSQTRTRRAGRNRLLILPLAMLALGLWSQRANFSAQPLAVVFWLAALIGTAALGRRLPKAAGTVWLPDSQQLQLPGSWLPLVLIVCIFMLRYTVAVGQAMHPAWRTSADVLLPVALLYGALSGLFVGRALGLLSLTRTATIASHELQPQR